MKTFSFSIITPEKVFLKEDSSFVVVPGFCGELGLLPEHMNLIALLIPGTVRMEQKDNSKKRVVIAGGVVDIGPTETRLYTSTAHFET
jgi:F0F1-type ATP synthase epsilon subunit